MSKKTDDDLLQEGRDRLAECIAAESENRSTAEEDIAFENGDQWLAATLLDRSGRPFPTINKVSGAIKQIVGDARQNRPRIKIRPVDSMSDPQVAELLTGLIRNIENVSDADGAYDNGIECAVRGGFGFWRVLTQYADDNAFEQDIFIKRIVNPFSVYFDQSSIESDYSDARFCFVSEIISSEQFEAKYPKADKVDWDNGTGGGAENWVFKDKRIRIAEYFFKEPYTKYLFELADGRVIEVKNPKTGEYPEVPAQTAVDPVSGQPMIISPVQPAQKMVIGDDMQQPLPYTRMRRVKCDRVMWAKLNGSQVLEGPQEWAGKYIPVVPCLGEEVWIDGKRILRSAIRFAKEPARIYNWTRANSIEIMALGPKQPWIGTEENFSGHETQWNNAHRRPAPYLKVNPDPRIPGGIPQRQQLDVSTVGIHNEALLAADDIKATTGIFDASLGAQGNETSGRAIIARQRQGQTSAFVYTDNQVRAIKHTGRILVDLIPKIYDTPRVVRLLGDDLTKQVGQIPGVQVAQNGMSAWAKINVLGPDGQVVANDLGLGKYDVVVDAGPGYATKRMEAADGLLQALQVAPGFAPIILPRIAKNLDWPEATEIADEIKKASQPPQPGADPRTQLEMEKGKLELQSKQLDNQGKVIDLQSKARGMAQDGAEGDQRMIQVAQRVVLDAFRQIGLVK